MINLFEYILYSIYIGIHYKQFITVLKYIKKILLFILSSMVWIHPIGYIDNHYDLDLNYTPYIIELNGVTTSTERFQNTSVLLVTSSQEFSHSERTIRINVPINIHFHLQNIANEQWHIVQDQLGRWYIGLVIEVINSYNEIVLCVDVLVSNTLFFQFPIQIAKTYLIDVLEEESGQVVLARDLEHNIRIQGLTDLPDSLLIVKTFWINIIQRKWKQIYKNKMRLLRFRGSLKSQRNFEICGKYGISTDNRYDYTLRGMLSGLKCSDCHF